MKTKNDFRQWLASQKETNPHGQSTGAEILAHIDWLAAQYEKWLKTLTAAERDSLTERDTVNAKRGI